MSRTLVIAECGSSHHGSFSQAFALIQAAKDADADVAKFQFWSDPARFAARRNAPDLAKAYSDFKVPVTWLPELRRRCDDVGIQFALSVYLPEDVWVVARYAEVLKVSSFEANDKELLVAMRAPLAVGKRIIISLGMGAATHPVRDWLLRGIVSEGAYTTKVNLLHCVSAYPADVAQLSLWRCGGSWQGGIPAMGFSDHSPSDHTWTGALSVAAGATVVERHLRLDSTPEENPDYPHSMSPKAFSDYVRHIRFAETVMGEASGVVERVPAACEEPMLKYRVVTA